MEQCAALQLLLILACLTGCMHPEPTSDFNFSRDAINMAYIESNPAYPEKLLSARIQLEESDWDQLIELFKNLRPTGPIDTIGNFRIVVEQQDSKGEMSSVPLEFDFHDVPVFARMRSSEGKTLDYLFDEKSAIWLHSKLDSVLRSPAP